MVKVEKQLSVFLDNRPGGLARICGTLSENDVNLIALTVHDTVDHAIVRVIADRPVKALLILEQFGLFILETDVVMMDMDNHSGALAEISRQLAHADINIEYAYCTASIAQGTGQLILKTDDPERTQELLSGF